MNFELLTSIGRRYRSGRGSDDGSFDGIAQKVIGSVDGIGSERYYYTHYEETRIYNALTAKFTP